MPRLGRFARSLQRLGWKPSVTDEVDSELHFHIDMRTRELIEKGMDPARARAEAVSRFGDINRVQTTLERIGRRRDRRERRTEWFAEMRQDVTYALRQLRRYPAFALLTTLTLGIGIGATTSIFSAVYAVVLRALPYSEPERIVVVHSSQGGNDESVSAATFFAWRDDVKSLRDLAAIEYSNFTLAEKGEAAIQVGAARVSAAYFPLLGVSPQLGRVFRPEEETPGRDQVVILSHRLWVQRFASDPHIVGRTLLSNSRQVEIVGVMPKSFDLSTDGEEIWAPMALSPEERADYAKGFLAVYGRLRPGATVAQATTEAKASSARLAERQSRVNDKRSVRIEPLFDSIVGSLRERLFILLGAVGLVLLIACGNVANLLLARGAARWREVAVRAAIGAGRGRIVRQLLTESAVLGVLGGSVGLVLATWGIKLIVLLSPVGVPRLDQARLDWPTLTFALALSLVSAVLFGLVPALRLAGANLQATLKEGGRAVGAGSTRDLLRRALVTAEVALSLVLLAGAGLLIRSGIQLQRVDPGFDPSHLFTAAMSLPRADYPTTESVTRAYGDIVERIRRTAGVQSAALVFSIPMFGANASAGINPEGRAQDASGQVSVDLHVATPGIFATMRIPVTSGRDLTDYDRAGAPRVAILNEAAARTIWPNESAIGKRFGLSRDSSNALVWWEVVGVVGDIRERGLRDAPRPSMYLSLSQVPPLIIDALQRTMFVVARSRGEPLALTKGIARSVGAVDPGLPLFAINSMDARFVESLAGARFNTALLSVLGAIGLALATVGIFGVISYFVSQRTQEIGLRMALGATPRRVLVLVVEQGLRPVVLGVVVGLAGAVAATRLLQALLFGVTPTDPLTLTGVAVVISAIAVVAAMVPARRATRIDPLSALRE